VWTETDLDAAALAALVGPALAHALDARGFRGLNDVTGRPDAFRSTFAEVAGVSEDTAALVADAAATLVDTRPRETQAWRHADLLRSGYPRPYQYEAWSVFRSAGYQGELVESPTGSGKTMIGMLCIQDWLRSLRPGQSILVLVPTANYQQQWIGELCYKPIGLRLAPELVFSGTPGQLERHRRRSGSHPAVILTTYTALAQAGSGVGKGGFDVDSIEMFLQEANVRYVLLDEVHKVVEDMASVSADVTRQLVAWVRDGSIHGLAGFSGTAEAYRPRFAQLGLRLAHSIPLVELVASGFVAPFAELGVPYSNSARERRIRDELDAYKARLLAFLEELGTDRLRGWFAEVPMEQRVRIARDRLRMFPGRPDGDELVARRLADREHEGPMGISEAQLVTILQVARGWSDADLARQAGVDPGRFEEALADLEARRTALRDDIYLPRTVERLSLDGFGTRLDLDAWVAAGAERTATARTARTEDVLATTFTGLYEGMRGWYLRAGEGRVETIKAIVEAERSRRRITGTIVFDTGTRIRWRQGVTAPGYDGVGGLFTQLLGDRRFTVFAALSSELYLSHDPDDPLPPRIADFVERELVRGEVSEAMFGLVTQGLDVAPETLERLRSGYLELVSGYVAGIGHVRGRRPGEFRRRILNPFRRAVRSTVKGPVGVRMLARLTTRDPHLDRLITAFYDYAHIAGSFRTARVAEVEQVSGALQRFFVVPMPGGRAKQLMYDLTARIVDAEELPVNMVLVSTWARTGWNVIRPNLLIDATATRDVTAWQQLRGRAMRASRAWTNDCYRLLVLMRGGEALGDEMPAEVRAAITAPARGATAIPADLRDRLVDGGEVSFTAGERREVAVGLLLARNKVTHIHELVKAFGSGRQVEYVRQTRRWQRREPIARKHAYESAVDVGSGRLVAGVGHAPLVYAEDPRTDLPDALQREVAAVIDGADAAIVGGWLDATDS
jgi:DEAD/DEAH box helicase